MKSYLLLFTLILTAFFAACGSDDQGNKGPNDDEMEEEEDENEDENSDNNDDEDNNDDDDDFEPEPDDNDDSDDDSNGDESMGPELPITVETPEFGAAIASPVTISGEAPGFWFYEAQFTVELYTEDDEYLGVAQLTAEGDWMTEEMVPFSGVLEFEVPEGVDRGYLQFVKANASGLPENEEFANWPIIFE